MPRTSRTTVKEARGAFALFRDMFAARYPRAPHRARRCALVIARRRCTDPHHCRTRDLAYAEPHEGRVVLLWRALALPPANVFGLLLHELGHVFDARVGAPGRERRADRVALAATGLVVRYDARDIQTIGRGTTPRPSHLHQ